MPIVSIIIPNYNHSAFLTQRIESVLNQTFQDFEVILMDDCSTDNSRDILDRYRSHPKVTHTIFNTQNSGSTFKQWKKGIDLSAGKFIWIAESDDSCEPTLLATLVEGINKVEDCVISYCQSICITDTEKIIFQSAHDKLSEMVEGKLFIQKYLSVPVSIFNASMALWRKDKFQFISEEFTTFNFCGDWFFWIQLSKLGKVHISGKVLNYFRKHSNDVSGKAYKSGLNFIEELKIINGLYQEQLITEKDYYRAYKRKFLDYWFIKDEIDSTNKAAIEKLFSTSLSSKTSLVKLIPSAIWRSLKQRWKKS